MRKHLSAVICLILTLFLLTPLTLYAENSPIIEPPITTEATTETEAPTPEPDAPVKLPTADLSNTDTLLFYCIDTETVLRTKNADQAVYPATAVKLMTALVTFERIPDLTQTVTVTSDMIAGVSGTYYGFGVGNVVSYEDLFKLMLLRKSNDAAQILAVSCFGSVDACVEAMNQKAASLGMTDTVFTNVSGVHDEAMTTTAADLLPLALSFYSNPTLLEWSGSDSLRCESLDRTIYNNNYFLSRYYNGTGKSYLYSAVSGMINGSTDESGEVLITSAKVNGYTYLVILLGGETVDGKPTCYTTTRELLETDSKNFTYMKVLREADSICELPVTLGQGMDYAAVFAAETLEYYLPKDLDPTKITTDYTLDVKSLEAPVEEGMTVGKIRVYYNGELLGETSLIVRTNIARSGTGYRLSQATDFISSKGFIRTALIVVALVALYFILNAVYREQVKKKYHTNPK